jgi:hypothetical protein
VSPADGNPDGAAPAFLRTRAIPRDFSLRLQPIGLVAGVFRGRQVVRVFIEIMPKATASLARSFGFSSAGWLATLGFFAGIVATASSTPASSSCRNRTVPGSFGRG